MRVHSKTLKIILLGLLQVFTILILKGIEGFFRINCLFCSIVNLPWCIGGDFNITRLPSERSRGGHLYPSMVDFSYFIFDQGLMDLPLVGGSFTWSDN